MGCKSGVAPKENRDAATTGSHGRLLALHTEERKRATHVHVPARGTLEGPVVGNQFLKVRATLGARVFVDRHPCLFTTPLDVTLHELLGVLFKGLVDLVQQLIEVLLDLLPLFRNLGVRLGLLTGVGWSLWSFNLCLLFGHGVLASLLPPTHSRGSHLW